MTWLLNFIPGAAVMRNLCIGLLVLSLAVSGAGLYGHRKGMMQERATQEAKATRLALEREQLAYTESESYRLRERAATKAQGEALEQAFAQSTVARADAVRAGDALARLLQRVAAASAGRGATPIAQQAAASGSAAGAATDLHPDVLGRVGEAAQQIAAFADQSRIAGRLCELHDEAGP